MFGSCRGVNAPSVERSRSPGLEPKRSPRWIFIAASLCLFSCGGASFPRETTATDARADDPWLEGGERCEPSLQDYTKLHVEELDAGTGAIVGDGQEVRVHYVARLPNGTVLHDTRHEGAPIEIFVGSTKIICGFEKALLGMRAGAQRRVTVPWSLAFGERGRPPDVPPQTDLTFVIELFLPVVATLENRAPPAIPLRGGGGGAAGTSR